MDQNAFRMKDMPLLPLIRAVEMTNSGSISMPPGIDAPKRIDWRTIDFVTDRSNLRKLLRWIDGHKPKRAVRIDAQLAGDGTVLLNRWEKRNREYGQGSYGFSLEKKATKALPGCEGATSYHRIVKYVSVIDRSWMRVGF